MFAKWYARRLARRVSEAMETVRFSGYTDGILLDRFGKQYFVTIGRLSLLHFLNIGFYLYDELDKKRIKLLDYEIEEGSLMLIIDPACAENYHSMCRLKRLYNKKSFRPAQIENDFYMRYAHVINEYFYVEVAEGGRYYKIRSRKNGNNQSKSKNS